MTDDSIDLTDFAPAHLPAAVGLSQAEQWPHRHEDWAMVLGISRGTVAQENGRVVGTIMATPFGGTAMVNMVIVAEDRRGRGLGRRLMEAALASAEGCECRLTATEDGLPLYRKFGFRETVDVLQHQGRAERIAAPAGFDIAFDAKASVETLAALDEAACGMDRASLFTRLCEVGEVAVLRQDGALAGFAVLRPFGRGEVVGPVVAGSAEEAKALIAFVVAARPNAFLRIDTTEDTGLGPFLTGCGLSHVGGGVAMRRGAATHPSASAATTAAAAARPRTFALASQALG